MRKGEERKDRTSLSSSPTLGLLQEEALGRKAKLNRERVLRAAIELVDVDGLDALTMRALADALGVGAMTLYSHVDGKDGCLDGMVEWVAREIHVPVVTVDWRISMRQRAVSIREMIVRHPWAGRLLESRSVVGPVRLRVLDASLGCLRHGGFSIEGAARALLMIDSFVYGFTMQETSWDFGSAPAEEAVAALEADADADADDLVHIAELVAHIMGDGDAFSSLPLEFDVGLDLTLDATATLRDDPR